MSWDNEDFNSPDPFTRYNAHQAAKGRITIRRVELVSLNEYELGRLQRWYLAHLLAEENSRDDDRLAERLKSYKS